MLHQAAFLSTLYVGIGEKKNSNNIRSVIPQVESGLLSEFFIVENNVISKVENLLLTVIHSTIHRIGVCIGDFDYYIVLRFL